MSIFSSFFGGGTKQSRAPFSIADKELLVRGWSDTELRQIIGDFQQMYPDRLPAGFSTAIHAGDAGALRVTVPADMAPELFCWLINYVQYPKNFDLKTRTILVAGRATISSDFLPASQELTGKRILFYIPADDRDFDVVFAQAEGQSYKYPFASERWQRIPEPRIPAGIGELK
jgi:hypothetical protein